MNCKYCGEKLDSKKTWCENCGEYIGVIDSSGNDDDTLTDSKDTTNTTGFKKPKKEIIIISAIAITILIIGGIFTFKHISSTKEKLNIEIKNINTDNYPIVTVKTIKSYKHSAFSKDNINIYNGTSLQNDFNITELSDGWEIKFTSLEAPKEELNTTFKIENKTNSSDFVQMDYRMKETSTITNVTNMNNDKLIEDIKALAESTLGKIPGKYSLSFKDMKKGDILSIKSEKAISASTIKIFIMIEAYSRINSGKLSESEIITLQENMKVAGSGILNGKPAGTELTVKELISLMMNKSDNVAANMLIDKLGMENINNRIKVLGCNSSELNRKMMDQAAIDNGVQNYTSSYDLALVLSKLYNGQCVNNEVDSKMLDIMKNNENKSKIPNKLPADVKVANKSGEFIGVENDAAIIYTSKGAYIFSITTTNGNSGEQVEAIRNLSKSIYDKYMESN